ncbi:hypothetical protein I5G58_gp004 [Mycobacterium phage BirdsNest]|uniref:Uncharacterized protein n=1 Tax=Mycobacterium phage BirdsNest TaxID=2686231 RepID=A0A6B9L6V9_9CAUD|nr:hypothetical protein I5G58_gp004 [Mycobacterium phage BirdsNest]QHB37306.1 hypothetical protein PBI_BIRDSNEST_4 [Mycobacterium phage BirdsNest]
MKWSREGDGGAYTAGPYRVERVVGSTWRASGPGMDPEVNWRGKNLAQDECRRACVRRLLGEGQAETEPVIGDVVVVPGTAVRGHLSSILTIDPDNPTYVLKTSRGKRHCLRRAEFEVVMP